MAKKLLKTQSPALTGIPNVGCGLTMDFDVKTIVTHTSEGVTISNIGTAHPEVVVYDSIHILHSSNASQSTNSKPSCNTAANY